MENSTLFPREEKAELLFEKILKDPEASENDKFVALTMLRNAEVASKGVLPFCLISVVALVIIVLVPEISLFLPNILYH